jgi:prefoldin subunit 5
MNDQDIYLLFSEQFRLIDDNLDDLVRRTESFTQANQIIESWKQANLNYLRARNKIFSSHMSTIAALVEEFQEAQDAAKQALEDLQAGAQTIDQISRLITLAVGKGTVLEGSV